MRHEAIQASSSWTKDALAVLTQVHSFSSFQGCAYRLTIPGTRVFVAQCVSFCALQAWRLSCLRSTSLFPQREASTSSVSTASVGNTGHFANEIDFTGSEDWKA